jgi:hypothetical protein
MAVILSGMVIFTTIQTQDFPDVEGDAATGRITLPIYAPEFSRAFTLLAVGFWSILLCWIWSVPSPVSILFILLGSLVGLRYYHYRNVDMDKTSYLLYNVSVAALIRIRCVILTIFFWHSVLVVVSGCSCPAPLCTGRRMNLVGIGDPWPAIYISAVLACSLSYHVRVGNFAYTYPSVCSPTRSNGIFVFVLSLLDGFVYILVRLII